MQFTLDQRFTRLRTTAPGNMSPLRSSWPSPPNVSPNSLRLAPHTSLTPKFSLVNHLAPLELSLPSFHPSFPLFSIACRLFFKNTGGGVALPLPSNALASTGTHAQPQCFPLDPCNPSIVSNLRTLRPDGHTISTLFSKASVLFCATSGVLPHARETSHGR